jgi:hypothetical protein
MMRRTIFHLIVSIGLTIWVRTFLEQQFEIFSGEFWLRVAATFVLWILFYSIAKFLIIIIPLLAILFLVHYFMMPHLNDFSSPTSKWIIIGVVALIGITLTSKPTSAASPATNQSSGCMSLLVLALAAIGLISIIYFGTSFSS